MKVFHTVKEVVEWRKTQVGDRCQVKIGFVPTMGALHAGHATLIRESVAHNDFTVCSVFVNPSQFAPHEDLDQYPRTLPQDIELLESLNCDVLFAPNAKEMYPQGIPLTVADQRGPFVSVLGISEMLEGKTRPNFFRGVATVVTKLLNVVAPDKAYFGQKDIQQFIVLDTMTKELFMNVELQMVPIYRSETGLALSSRNKYLSDESKTVSANLYAGLHAAETLINNSRSAGKSGLTRSQVESAVMAIWTPFIESKDFKVDYLSIARHSDLKEVTDDKEINDNTVCLVISCAVYVSDRLDPTVQVRLIDNVLIQ
ncbi:pantoate--beta-alanine ligase [Monosporozyma unispora]|nr:pantothenate synthase [Kazachstania unispora]